MDHRAAGGPTLVCGMRDDHPKPDLLARFMAGEASRAERSAVIQHLLTGCRECLAVTRQIWGFVERGIKE